MLLDIATHEKESNGLTDLGQFYNVVSFLINLINFNNFHV